MEKLIQRIDPNLKYEWSEVEGDIMRVYAVSARSKAQMPILWELLRTSTQRLSAKVSGFAYSREKSRSHYKEPEVFCQNPECEHKTFVERYEFLPRKARNSRWLTQAIVNTSIHITEMVFSRIQVWGNGAPLQ